jgi:hypothetical protein
MARAWELWTDYKLRFRANTSRRSRRPCSDTEHALSGRRPPIFCCIRSRRCSVWSGWLLFNFYPCSFIDVHAGISPGTDQRCRPPTGRRPPAADDLGLLASAAWLIRRGRGEHGGRQAAYGECLPQGDVTQPVRSAFWTGIGLLDHHGDSDRGRGCSRGARPLLEDHQLDGAEQGVPAHTGRAGQRQEGVAAGAPPCSAKP